MKKFIIHNASGEILRTGECSENAFDFQAAEGEFIIEGEANDATQMIVNGAVVNKPPPPPPAFNLLLALGIKAKQISSLCEAEITAGFESNALGTIHTYPSDRDDQLNLSGTIQRSMMAGVLPTDTFAFLCKNSSNEWGYVFHTPLQIQKVGEDAYLHILNARVKNATLQGQINNCTTQAELDLIVW
jgi:hypothetical protein